MRDLVLSIGVLAAASAPCFAQSGQSPSIVTPEQRRAVSNEKAAEVKTNLDVAKKRQIALDSRTTDLWVRWTHAVCIGCGPTPNRLRIVHTYPRRVLQGIPAALDDMRERRGLRI